MNKIGVKRFIRFRSYCPPEYHKFDIQFYRFLHRQAVELIYLNLKLECQSIRQSIEPFDPNENTRILGDCKAENYLKNGLFNEG